MPDSKILETENSLWKETFVANWEDLKKTQPNLTFEESVEISIKIRTVLRSLLNLYVKN